MKVNIVTEPNPGWVLRNISEHYAKFIENAVVNTEADFSADINFYVNYYLFKEKTNIDVGFFTHRELHNHENAKIFDENAIKMDWCIAMCDKTARLLPKNKTTVIHVAPDEQFYKGDIIIGIVAKEQQNNRKRFDQIDELKKISGIKIKLTGGNIPWNEIPDFYKSIDYLLILSENEGGPVTLLEALSLGVPVIAPDVGFVPDYTTIRYNSFDDLKKVINGLVIPKNAWEKSAEKLKEVFDRLYNGKVH